jgi:hypothetical protein
MREPGQLALQPSCSDVVRAGAYVKWENKGNPTTEKVVVCLSSDSKPIKRKTGCTLIISRDRIVLRSMDGAVLIDGY